MATTVVADANALLMPFESRIRIDAELERLLGSFTLVVPTSVLAELRGIASAPSGKRSENARLALALAARYPPVAAGAAGDAGVLEVAGRLGALVFTNDRDLVKRALSRGLGVVRLKGKSHLIVETRQGESR